MNNLTVVLCATLVSASASMGLIRINSAFQATNDALLEQLQEKEVSLRNLHQREGKLRTELAGLEAMLQSRSRDDAAMHAGADFEPWPEVGPWFYLPKNRMAAVRFRPFREQIARQIDTGQLEESWATQLKEQIKTGQLFSSPPASGLADDSVMLFGMTAQEKEQVESAILNAWFELRSLVIDSIHQLEPPPTNAFAKMLSWVGDFFKPVINYTNTAGFAGEDAYLGALQSNWYVTFIGADAAGESLANLEASLRGILGGDRAGWLFSVMKPQLEERMWIYNPTVVWLPKLGSTTLVHEQIICFVHNEDNDMALPCGGNLPNGIFPSVWGWILASPLLAHRERMPWSCLRSTNPGNEQPLTY